MYRLLLISICFFCSQSPNLYGQLVPADSAVLNYTQVMFEHPAHTNAAYYKLFITPVDLNGNPDTSNQLQLQTWSPALLIRSGLEFGRKYQWHYEVFFKTRGSTSSPVFNFSIAASPQTNENLYCFTVTQKTAHNNDSSIIFFDSPGVAINKDGKVVWYMPMDSSEMISKGRIRNLHITPFGTMLYLSPENIVEKTIDNKIQWQGPANTGTAGAGKDLYHHDCRMLADGSILVCDYDYENEPCPYSPGDVCQVRYNTVLQMNKEGKILWKWNEKGQVDTVDLYPGKNPAMRKTEGSHMNGFAYNESTKSMVFSFRNNSRIIKIDKETGKMLWSLKPGTNNIFYGSQHGIVFTKAGEILFYNNEGAERHERSADRETKAGWPVIMILKETEKNKPPVKVWEYTCATPAFKGGVKGKEGYASELPNGNILVCMGSANRSFEVSRKKQIVWECFYERFNDMKKEWSGFPAYRCQAATSLFPYYFTMQKNNEAAIGQTVSFQLFNTGSNDDVYTLSLDTQKGFFKNAVQVVALKAGESKLISFSFNKNELLKNGKVKKPSKIVVNVTSGNSSIAKRQIDFDWNL